MYIWSKLALMSSQSKRNITNEWGHCFLLNQVDLIKNTLNKILYIYTTMRNTHRVLKALMTWKNETKKKEKKKEDNNNNDNSIKANLTKNTQITLGKT